ATAPPRLRPILRLTPPAANVCGADLDGKQLQRFADRYDVFLACGLMDPTIDKMRDPRITLSRPFTIQPGTITVAVPHSPVMSEAIQNRQNDAFGAAPPPPPGMMTFTLTQIGVWVHTVLLPKGTDPNEIHQLADVIRHQGQIITQD